ncbi:MAG: Hsp33 family molecular chaperone HslO [Chromatiaceae bacterium]
MSDSLHRFLFERAGVRGELVYLDASWRAVLDIHAYPDPVRQQLGKALAAVLLLTGTIKFEGSLILQAQGDGPLRTLVAQATHRRTIRGLARWNGAVPDTAGLADIFGDGSIAITIEPLGGERYQGIVPLEGADLAAALETYFSSSEQLDTRLWLTATEQRATGLLLQRLPAEGGTEEDWKRISLLAQTVTVDELVSLPAEELLYRLFNEETVRLFESEPVAFRCTCSRQRIEDTLRAMGEAEIESIVEEHGAIEVDCEFCNRHYHLDRVDALKLFAASVPHEAPPSQH